VNESIRSGEAFDAFVDLDVATRDPTRPTRLQPNYDSGVQVHSNDAGNRAMAAKFNLGLLKD
jgi:hypothetical protein